MQPSKEQQKYLILAGQEVSTEAVINRSLLRQVVSCLNGESHPPASCSHERYRDIVGRQTEEGRYLLNKQLSYVLSGVHADGTIVDWGTGEALYYDNSDFWWRGMKERGVSLIPIERDSETVDRAVREGRLSERDWESLVTSGDIPYNIPDSSVGAVMGISSLHLLPHGQSSAVLGDLCRILKPGSPLVHVQPFGVTATFLQGIDQRGIDGIERHLTRRYPSLELDQDPQYYWGQYGGAVWQRLSKRINATPGFTKAKLQPLTEHFMVNWSPIHDRQVFTQVMTSLGNTRGLRGAIGYMLKMHESIDDTYNTRLLSDIDRIRALARINNVTSIFVHDLFTAWIASALDMAGFGDVQVVTDSMITPLKEKERHFGKPFLVVDHVGTTRSIPVQHFKPYSNYKYTEITSVVGTKPS